ncbi:MAG: hypothetical protein O2930_13770 [Acidobacteria bacterium]|nr:hypothetical protein [Chloroflexota bacterium]MDA1185699.1 hypothetical protein [Acidobacteriota bacterium]
MEKMTREEWVAEFGEPSVENPNIVDLIEVDPASGQVVLVMIERREWDSGPQQFTQIEEKINRYMGYVLDGHLTTHYPQYEGKAVQIRLNCAQEPSGTAVRFVAAAERSIRAHGLEFVVNVAPAHGAH